jgi:3-methyladenine DNA glycosylase AlkD
MEAAPPDDATVARDLLTRALRELGSPERAAWDQAYHKSKGLEHWGVRTPLMRRLIATTLAGATPAMALELARRLWNEPVWDLKIAAFRLAAHKSVPADGELWRFVTARVGELDGWAVADTLADVGARCLVADPGRLDVVEAWVESRHLWTRRASLVFTLPWTKAARDPERMLGWAARLALDREWFIQKAIGWWLRELGKRDPGRVRRFLNGPGVELKGFAKREAEKYL